MGGGDVNWQANIDRVNAENEAIRVREEADARAAAAIRQANAAAAELNKTPEKTPEQIKAEATALRVAQASKNAKIEGVRNLAELQTDRMFRMFGMRSAFRGGTISPLFG